jgi:hypothetical protein
MSWKLESINKIKRGDSGGMSLGQINTVDPLFLYIDFDVII